MIISNECDNDSQVARKVRSVLDNSIWIPINNFSINELKCKCGCNSIKIEENHLLNLQCFRNYLNKKYKSNIRLIISSGYRCVKHNKAVGGVKNSTHTKGEATDVYSPDISDTLIYAEASECGIFSTVIHYSKSNFVHLDSRVDRSNKHWDWDK